MDLTLERIVAELKAQGLKKIDLTNHLGLVSSCFGNWMAGRNTSYRRYLHGIADFLGVSVEYLRGETDIKEKPPILSDRGQMGGHVTVLSPHEERVILAYRAQPALQAAVDKLLDVGEAAAPSQSETA